MNRTLFDKNTDVNDFVAWMGRFEVDDEGNLRPLDAPLEVGNPERMGGDGVRRRNDGAGDSDGADPAGGCGGGATATPGRPVPFLPVTLAIGKSKWTPTPIAGTYPLHELTRVYCWRAAGMAHGNFKETRCVVKRMSDALSTAATDEAAASACGDILTWGGERDRTTGARAFLASRPSLRHYLGGVQADLALNVATLPFGVSSQVLAMNSMLSKVHAFNAGDGLPIYDSRVAGAIATVIETWRQQTRPAQPLPDVLTFPAAGGGGFRRHVHSRYPGCPDPGTIHYAPQSSPARTAHNAWRWSSAKVRLGWLLSRLLVNPTPAGLRSLEACLFMAGYDCSGINVP